MQNVIQHVIVIGNFGVGKTEFIKLLAPRILAESGIHAVVQSSDRLYFEQAVRRDTQGKPIQSDGSVRGAHSVMVKDGVSGHMSFFPLDGSIFNEAHKRMIRDIAGRTSAGTINLVEYATGPNGSFTTGEALDQSARFLVDALDAHHLIDRTLVIELSASFDLRKHRNNTRKDTVEPRAFELYGQPGGNMTDPDADRLGNLFIHLQNEKGVVLDQIVSEVFFSMHHLFAKDTNVRGSEGRFGKKEIR